MTRHGLLSDPFAPLGRPALEGEDPRQGTDGATSRVADTWHANRRLALRSGTFLDEAPDPAEVPPELVEEIRANWASLQAAWNKMYPENPVESEDDDQR
jgi:hypothetical protein